MVFSAMKPNAQARYSVLLFLLLLKLEMMVAFTVPLSGHPSFAFGTPNPSLSSFNNGPLLAWPSTTASTTALLVINKGGLYGDETQRDFSWPSSSSSSSFPLQEAKSERFATGNELKQLRSDLEKLQESLLSVQASGHAIDTNDRVEQLTKAIENCEQRDPDIVYRKALKEVIDAKVSHLLSEDERLRRVQNWTKEAAVARKCIARFQLEGLWVGHNTGASSGLELINVTYAGDTLMATKVVGDTYVPRGQVLFTAELSPLNCSSLTPLNFSVRNDDSTNTAATATAQLLLRYSGKGQIISDDNNKKKKTQNVKSSSNTNKYVDGQLVMLNDDQFSFLWTHTSQFIVFSRPTPEQTIRLLRDTIAREDELERMRNHVARCFVMDMTESLARFHAQQDYEDQPVRRIKLNSELEQAEARQHQQQEVTDILNGSSSSSNRLNFWHLSNWRECIDRVFGNTDKKQQT